MNQKGVQKQYAYSEENVVKEPEELVSNAGEVCTEDAVDEAIAALTSIGYGVGRTPREMSAEQVSLIKVGFLPALSLHIA